MSKKTEERPDWYTAANLVTLIRIIFIPVFVVVILASWPSWFPNHPGLEAFKPWLAAIIFAILAYTDGLDGYLARSRNQVSTVGKFIDPIADKLLVVAALLALIELGSLPSWIVLIIVAREFLVSGLRMIAAADGLVIAASWIGKWKTGITIVAILLFIVKDSSLILNASPTVATVFNVVAWVAMIAALILTIWSMIDYFTKSLSALGFTGSKEQKDE